MSSTPLGASIPSAAEPDVDVSVVCPFYNEEAILAGSIRALLAELEALDGSWELLVVNDGSRDGSEAIAREIAETESNLRVLGYPYNRGRGHALRTGIAQARGRVVVTTEIDLSWGPDIVERLVAELRRQPDADLVVASPHLPGGGYRNVPFVRVQLSNFGNWIIRACITNVVTMNTGMTRAYRREAIRSLPLEEDGKEFHLEVIRKAQAFHYRIVEIPAVLEWKEHKHRGRRVKRKSSTRVNRLIVTHGLFSLFANPIRYVWGLAVGAGLLSLGFLALGVVRLALGLVSVYSLILSLTLAVLALLLFVFGVLAQQGNLIQRELWWIRRELMNAQPGPGRRPRAAPDERRPPARRSRGSEPGPSRRGAGGHSEG